MKDPHWRKTNVQAFIMRRFFDIYFMMVGMMVMYFVAFMVYSYERSLYEWKSSTPGSQK